MIRCFLVCALLMVLAACATVIDGNKQEIMINSVPEGASVYFNIKEKLGKTPLKVNLSRNETAAFILKKKGYKDQAIYISKSVNRRKHLNAAALPVYGLTSTIDEFSGAGYKFTATDVVVELLKKDDNRNRKRQCIGCKFLG